MAEAGGGNHTRTLFFEAVFATRMFQEGVSAIQNSWTKAQENMRASQAASAEYYKSALAGMAAQAQGAYDVKTKLFNQERDQAIKAWTEQTTAYQAALDKQVAAAEVAAKAKMAANSTPAFLGGAGQLALPGVGSTNNAAAAAAIAERDAEIKAATESMEAQIADANAILAAKVATADTQIAMAGTVRDKEIAAADAALQANVSKTTQVTSMLKGAAQTVGSSFLGLGIGVGILGALYMGLDHVVVKYINWAAETARLSSATGVEVEAMQELILRGQEFGVTAERMETFLTRFARATVTNSQAFRNMGIDTTNTTTSLEGLMNILAKTTDDAQKLVIVTSLMPGSSKNAVGNIVAMLSETSAQFEKQIALGKQMGIILDHNAVSAGMFGKAIHDVMLQNLQGVENIVAQALLPNMEALWVVISSGLSSAKGGIASFASALAGVLGSVLGFMSGLFGIQIDWNKAMANTVTTLQQQAQAQDAANAGAAMNAQIQESQKQQAKDLTDANKDLNRAQQEQTKAQTEGLKDLTNQIGAETTAIDRQIQAINDNVAAFNAAEDAKVRALETEKTNLSDLQKLEDDLHTSTLARLQDELDASKDVNDRRMKSNETIVDYQRRMYQLDLTNQITAEQTRRSTEADTLTQTIDLLKQKTDAEKLNLKTTTDLQIDALTVQKQALQDYLKARTDAIQSQMQAEQDATTAMVDANQAKIEQLQQTDTQAAAASAGAYTLDFAEMSKQVKGILESMRNSATGTANDIGGAINAIFLGKQMTSQQRDALDRFGRQMGSAIWDGIVAGIEGAGAAAIKGGVSGQGPLGFLLNPGGAGLNLAQNLLNGGGSSDYFKNFLGHADGGVFSSPHLANVAEGGKAEAIIPLTNPTRAAQVMQQAGLTSPGGGTTLIANFNGPVADAMVAGRVTDRLLVDARRKNLIYGSGVG